MRKLILGLGANCRGTDGTPLETMRALLPLLERAGLRPLAASPLYRTAPLGGPRQDAFLNAVIIVRSDLPPSRVLAEAKRLERAAGRKVGSRWGPRPLDIDILDDRAVRLNSNRPIASGSADRLTKRHAATPGPPPANLVLPHPRLHQRAFVLAPLLDLAPAWRHPVLGVSAFMLLRRLAVQRRGVTRTDHTWHDEADPPRCQRRLRSKPSAAP